MLSRKHTLTCKLAPTNLEVQKLQMLSSFKMSGGSKAPRDFGFTIGKMFMLHVQYASTSAGHVPQTTTCVLAVCITSSLDWLNHVQSHPFNFNKFWNLVWACLSNHLTPVTTLKHMTHMTQQPTTADHPISESSSASCTRLVISPISTKDPE